MCTGKVSHIYSHSLQIYNIFHSSYKTFPLENKSKNRSGDSPTSPPTRVGANPVWLTPLILRRVAGVRRLL